jgi:hypothetical protein
VIDRLKRMNFIGFYRNAFRSLSADILSLLTLVALLFVAAVHAENSSSTTDDLSNWQTQLSSTARFNYFTSDNQLNDEHNFFGTTARGKFDADFKEWLSIELDARVTQYNRAQHVLSQTNDSYSHIIGQLTQGYATLKLEDTTLRLGKQIVVWGRADFLNPTDNLTPHNYAVLLPDEADQRFGTVSALLTHHFNQELTFTLFTTPFFEPSQIPLPQGIIEYAEEKPEHTLNHSEFGIRLNRAGDRIDGSLSYFHGYNLQPDLAPLTWATVALSYAEIHVFGMDLATNVGRYGLRMEAAYTRTDDPQGRDPFRRNSFWYYVIGADRSLDDTLTINVQFFGRHISNFTQTTALADPLAQAISDYDALIAQQQDRDSYGMTTRISNSWLNDTVSAEVLLVRNFTRSNSYFKPLLTYAISDRLTASIGAQLYSGRSTTFFGILKDNQYVFTELRYSL